MTTSHALLAYLIASSLLTITPGLDTALVLRTAAVGGAMRAIGAGAGVCLGCLTWGLLASVGLGALLQASHLAYEALRIAGACYLVYLGARLIGRSGSGVVPADDTGSASAWGDDGPSVGDAWPWFARGLLTNLLNPKVGVFYVTFLPLFIPPGRNVMAFGMLLAAIHASEGIVWFAALIAAVRPLSRWLRRASLARTLDRITGVVFVGFGLRLLLDRSR